jgi:hypothetical protein
VELIKQPTIKPTIEPTAKTTVDAHQYAIQTDHNQFGNIFIITQSKLIAINSSTMPIDIQSKPIAIATIPIIGCTFIGHLAIYAGCFNPLIVLWSITAIAILQFFAIHLITRMSTHEQFQA